MAFDYKKEYKEFYLPPRKPQIIEIPSMNFLAVRGQGDPNEEGGAYKESIGLLYGIAYTIKMSKMGRHKIKGYFDYVVPPLEGFWWQEGIAGIDYSRKKDFQWISLIRLPEFVTKEEFEQKIRKGEFVEYEEVYAGSYYGTLQSEVERIWAKGHIILFDIDVKGGINIKRLYGRHALAVFIQPPSVEALKERLVKRGTDSPQAIERRVAKAEEELEYAKNFDRVIVNDSLECALREAEAVVETFYNE